MVGNVRELFRGSHQNVQRQTAGGWRKCQEVKCLEQRLCFTSEKSRGKDESKELINMENYALSQRNDQDSSNKNETKNLQKRVLLSLPMTDHCEVAPKEYYLLYPRSTCSAQCRLVGWGHRWRRRKMTIWSMFQAKCHKKIQETQMEL